MDLTDRKGNLVIVSNRLPVSIKQISQGEYRLTPSSGGLVTGLQGLANGRTDIVWYGWPGSEITLRGGQRLRGSLLKDHNAIPVHLDDATADLHYNGFSNSTIWPLFHSDLEKVCFDDEALAGYRKANKAFADAILPDLKDGDRVWVHDYHLMLLPLMLRQRAEEIGVSIRVGWFLHTPFPSKDFFDVLPSGSDILEGILGADMIGFQTNQARQNFMHACSDLPGCLSDDLSIMCNGRKTSIRTLPIGIEPSQFRGRLQKTCVQDTMACMKDNFRRVKVILGIDRLDCIKGIPQKLHAFSRLL